MFKKMRTKASTLSAKILVIIVSIVLVLVSVIGAYFYFTTSEILYENTSKDISHMLLQINNTMESQLDIIDSTLQFFMLNPNVREDLEKDTQGDSYSQAMKKIDIEKQLSYLLLYNYLWDSKCIKSVYIFNNSEDFYHIERTYSTSVLEENQMIYNKCSKSDDELQIFPPSSTNHTLYFARNLKNMYSLDYVGTIIMGIDVDTLQGTYSGVNQYQGAQAFLIDSNNTVVLNTDMSLLGRRADDSLSLYSGRTCFLETKMNGDSYYIASKAIDKYAWTSIILIPKKQVFSKLSSSFSFYINVILILLVVFLILSVFLSSLIMRPIRKLMSRIELVRKGNYDVKMPRYNVLELDQLSEAFNKMTGEIQYLINDVYKKQLLLTESELKALQAQINPHFLFNVLDTVLWYARAAKNDEIAKIIAPLGHILRTNITMGSREKIRVNDELQYIEFYMSIQKSRFGERLQTEIRVEDDDIRDLYIPKLCIQPIVENAIVHGLEEKVSDGILAVNAYRRENLLVFEVIDNGVGFNPDDINLDGPETNVNEMKSHTNIGLYNANKRIKLLYGEEYGITLESNIGVGSKVTVILPQDHGEQHV
jgi:two-component system sensor histidine kinase YesM